MWLVNHIPAVAVMDAARYSGPAVDMAFVLLAALALDDVSRLPPMRPGRIALIIFLVVGLAALAVMPNMTFTLSLYKQRPDMAWISLLAFLLTILCTGFVVNFLRAPIRPIWVILSVLILPLGNFIVPQFSGLSGGKLDQGVIEFLKQNTGLQRMASTGPFGLNFPDRYGIASVNYNALPVPLLWTDSAHALLDPKADLNSFDVSGLGQSILDYLPAYANFGVKYLVVRNALDYAKHDFALTANIGNETARPLFAGGEIEGEIDQAVPLKQIAAASVKFGTYGGTADGIVQLQLCNASGFCETSQIMLAQVQDNSPALFVFNPPLPVEQGKLTYQIKHLSGTHAVAVWMVGDKPRLQLAAPWQAPIKGLAYQGTAADVIELEAPRPYFEVTGAHCTLDATSRTLLSAQCAGAATLTRLELYDPGWHVLVNGHSLVVQKSGIVQAVQLKTGLNEIRFYYEPPHIKLAILIAVIGLALWAANLGLGIRSRAV